MSTVSYGSRKDEFKTPGYNEVMVHYRILNYVHIVRTVLRVVARLKREGLYIHIFMFCSTSFF